MSDSYKVYASKECVENKILESRVQPDWNQNDPTAADYVKGRTHYEGLMTLVEWDGNKDGLETTVAAQAGSYVRVSDIISQDLHEGLGVTLVGYVGGEDKIMQTQLVASTYGDMADTAFLTEDMSAWFVPNDSLLIGVDFPSAGVWVLDLADATGDETAYIKSCKAEIIKTIDPKYLPAGGSGGVTDEHINSLIDAKLNEFDIPEELPIVTTDNNGAFLRVVDGVWAVATIANAEEASF